MIKKTTVLGFFILLGFVCITGGSIMRIVFNNIENPSIAQGAVRHIGTVDECHFNRMKEPFLTRGYRIGYNFRDCIESAFEYNNETVNIWTHFIALLVMLGIQLYTFEAVLPDHWTIHHFWNFCVYVPSVCSMTSSVLFHTFRSLNEVIYANVAMFDFTFIALSLIGNQIPHTYYALYERPRLRKFYFALLAVLAAVGVAFCTSPSLTHPALRVLRTLMFVFIGFYDSIISINVLIVDHGKKEVATRLKLNIVGSIIAGIAVPIYLFRFPERSYPGTFDLWLNSHILMHLICMLAAWVFCAHYVINYKALCANEKKPKKQQGKKKQQQQQQSKNKKML